MTDLNRATVRSQRRRAMLTRRLAQAHGDPRRVVWALADYCKAAVLNAPDEQAARELAGRLLEQITVTVDRMEGATT